MLCEQKLEKGAEAMDILDNFYDERRSQFSFFKEVQAPRYAFVKAVFERHGTMYVFNTVANAWYMLERTKMAYELEPESEAFKKNYTRFISFKNRLMRTETSNILIEIALRFQDVVDERYGEILSDQEVDDTPVVMDMEEVDLRF